MARLPGWFVMGLLAIGFSTAMLVGAGVANAETDPAPRSHAQSQDGKPAHSFGVKSIRAPRDVFGGPARRSEFKPSRSDARQQFSPNADRQLPVKQLRASAPDQPNPANGAVGVAKADRTSGLSLLSKIVDKSTKSIAAQHDSVIFSTQPEAGSGTAVTAPELPRIRERVAAVSSDVRQRLTSLVGSARAPAVAVSESAALPAAPSTSLLGPAEVDYPPLVRLVGSVPFDLIAGLIHLVQGPPTVPAALRDSVEVSTSTLVIAPGNEVEANWYMPIAADDDPPPQGFIYLQHGILASGPMYSYTAAYLAERTNSIVVTTTLTSNPFAAGGMWLGGDNMHKAVAQLFLDDDRSALNASLATAALKAGRDDIVLPDRFVLVGHSLGGGFAPGVAGYYAEGLMSKRETDPEAPNQLAGVILYDAVPISPIMPDAMARLKVLENYTDPSDPNDVPDAGDYVPVYEIGAPANFLNSTSNVNDELSAARPGKFNGVVLDGGVHMDAMQGGNPLIQFAAYLVAGFPQPQNPPAVQELSVGWIMDMYNDKIDPATGACAESAGASGTDCQGSYGGAGQSISIVTAGGDTATAVVIGSAAGLAPLESGRAAEEAGLLSSSESASIQPIPPSDFPPVVRVLAAAAFDTLSALIQVVDGAPVIPPALRGSVQVSTSTLVIAPGHEVEANWYRPVTAADDPPDRLIYLQPGFLATAPMYSYTAAYLAERTNSVVVVTTLNSNFTVADGMWVGGDPMHKAVAQLFLDDNREALNASLTTAALKAGWDYTPLPDQFVLVGHSAGGGFAPGVAGYYAEGLVEKRENGHAAPNQLAGVLMYDGVPTTPVLPNAMERLKALEDYSTEPAGTPDPDFVPVYEIGAPSNLFNSTSHVNEELSAARPDQFVGVVLDGGVHMDSMQGGNLLIQVVAYLVAGFPQPQNPPAVQELSVGWINDMFDDKIDPDTGKCLESVVCQGRYGDPGGSFPISTQPGQAIAQVIDSRVTTAAVSV